MLLQDENLYQVGGYVRDELLGIESVDIDYTYEGDAIEFAQKSGLNIVKVNPRFHTVRVTVGDKEIDIASTRKESYPRNGHLPRLCRIGVPIEEDLKRRDFTINAIAKRTTDGEIVDVFDGRKDIKNKVLRILHKKSFFDDPTRIVRGLKFSVRLGFELEEETHIIQQEYLDDIDYDMSYHRLKNELKDAFSLNRHEIFDRFIEQKIYKLLGKNQQIPNIDSKNIEQMINNYPSEYSWLVYLSFFDLSNLDLTRLERKIPEWSEKLKTEDANRNTPFESILIQRLRNDQCIKNF